MEIQTLRFIYPGGLNLVAELSTSGGLVSYRRLFGEDVLKETLVSRAVAGRLCEMLITEGWKPE